MLKITPLLILLTCLMLSCTKPQKFRFEKGKKQIYQSEYRDSQGNLIFNETLEFAGTGEKTHFSEKQDKIFYTFNYTSEDSARFVQNPRLYKTFTYSKSWQKTFSQGIIQNEERLWLHPLRANQYRFTQYSPFPEVRFPLEEGKQWTGNNPPTAEYGNTIDCRYEVMSKGIYQGPFGILKDCWFVKGSCNFEEFTNELLMTYHEEHGFIEFSYDIHNGDQVLITLIETGAVTEADYQLYEQRDARNR